MLTCFQGCKQFSKIIVGSGRAESWGMRSSELSKAGKTLLDPELGTLRIVTIDE